MLKLVLPFNGWFGEMETITNLRHYNKFEHYYRPQTKFAKVMFLHMPVILSTGGSASVHPGMHPTPPGPETDPPPGTMGRHLPYEQTPPPSRTRDRPPPSSACWGGGQQAGDTHPTGMHTSLSSDYGKLQYISNRSHKITWFLAKTWTANFSVSNIRLCIRLQIEKLNSFFNCVKVAEFPKLALKHGILLNLPI